MSTLVVSCLLEFNFCVNVDLVIIQMELNLKLYALLCHLKLSSESLTRKLIKCVGVAVKL